MECTEFREIIDSHLCDELLVETNHKILLHLQQCVECRCEFDARRRLRLRLRQVVFNDPQFRIDPHFDNRLRLALKEAALAETFVSRIFRARRILIPAVAATVFLVFVGFGLLALKSDSVGNFALGNLFHNSYFMSKLSEITSKAVGDHLSCALDKLQLWERFSDTDYPDREKFEVKVLKPIRAGVPGNVEMLHAHKCTFEGMEFTHVILRYNSDIVSVFFDDTDFNPELTETGALASYIESGMKVARFSRANGGLVLVVSQLPEAENVKIARALSDSMKNSGNG